RIAAPIAHTKDQETTRAIGECAASSEHALFASLIILEWQSFLEIEILGFKISHSKNLQDVLDCPLIQSLWQRHREAPYQMEINNRRKYYRLLASYSLASCQASQRHDVHFALGVLLNLPYAVVAILTCVKS